MTFDTPIDRRNTHSNKWDDMEKLYGVSPDGGIAMWLADMEFRAPPVVQDAVQQMADHGIYGYFGDDTAYRGAITWWMKTRHDWQVDPASIFSTNGLVNGAAMCVDAFTAPGDAIVLFTPVYHSFARVIKAADRDVRECELSNVDGRYELDFDNWDAQMTGTERMLIFCSPHNPSGRVWSRAELQAVAAFAKRHGLILVSDEIHHDLTMPGQTHIPMVHIPDIADRLVMMSATTKTFNIAGSHTGNVIIADPDLRARFAKRMSALGISANAFGLRMATAAYSPAGAAWVDDLCAYLDENRRIFDAGVNAIPGVHSMPLDATYLAWVDFAGTGMEPSEVIRRVQQDARIAASHGASFGKGGETFLRFNIGTTRAQIVEAVARLQSAFADLQ